MEEFLNVNIPTNKTNLVIHLIRENIISLSSAPANAISSYFSLTDTESFVQRFSQLSQPEMEMVIQSLIEYSCENTLDFKQSGSLEKFTLMCSTVHNPDLIHNLIKTAHERYPKIFDWCDNWLLVYLSKDDLKGIISKNLQGFHASTRLDQVSKMHRRKLIDPTENQNAIFTVDEIDTFFTFEELQNIFQKSHRYYLSSVSEVDLYKKGIIGNVLWTLKTVLI